MAADVAPMATWLACDNEDIRRGAARQLGDTGVTSELRAEALATQLLHPNLGVRTRAATALSEMGPQAAAPHVAELVLQLSHPEKARRVAALEALYNLGPVAGSQAEVVALRLWDEDLEIRCHAGRALGSFGEAAVPHIQALTDQHRHRDAQAREQIADCLGDIGAELPREPSTEAVADALADTLCYLAHDHTEAVRRSAGQNLARIIDLATPRLQRLSLALGSFEPDAIRAALEVYVHLRAASTPWAAAIAPMVWHKDAGVRMLAAKALEGMGSGAHWHAEEFGEEMISGPPERQRLAVAALTRMGTLGAEVLQVKAVHTDHGVRKAAQLALEEMRRT